MQKKEKVQEKKDIVVINKLSMSSQQSGPKCMSESNMVNSQIPPLLRINELSVVLRT